MSWSCYCPGAVERGREHMPGAYAVCPYCERTRAHSELRQAALAVLDPDADGHAALNYLASCVNAEED